MENNQPEPKPSERTSELLHQLRAKLVKHLLTLIETGEAKPADLAVATKLLRDNEITADPRTDRDAQELAEELEELKNLRLLPGGDMAVDDTDVRLPN